jgi:hypothetical protein
MLRYFVVDRLTSMISHGLEKVIRCRIISVMSGVYVINWFCGVVGYHFCLTHRRS